MELIKEILNIIDIFTAIFLVYFIITGLCVLIDKNYLNSYLDFVYICNIISYNNKSILYSFSKVYII